MMYYIKGWAYLAKIFFDQCKLISLSLELQPLELENTVGRTHLKVENAVEEGVDFTLKVDVLK